MSIFDQLADGDPHEAHALRVIHRVFLIIGAVFFCLLSGTVATRWGMDAPPESMAYGTIAPSADAVLLP
jgi:hypothetical protein